MTTGIGILNKFLKLILLVSCLTNVYILFYMKNIETSYPFIKKNKFLYYSLINYFILVFVFFMNYDFIKPYWMNYYDKVKHDLRRVIINYLNEKNKTIRPPPSGTKYKIISVDSVDLNISKDLLNE
jgi:hypothetical protein